MKILGFETASGRCSVCITNNIEILATETLLQNSMQAENLTSMIDSALIKAKTRIEEIDFVATSNGPGSFTGIRIGLSTCLGIVLGSKIKPAIISNFSAINYRIREQYRNFDEAYAIIDANRSECYYQKFDRSGKHISPHSLGSISEIRNILLKSNSRIVVAGSGAKHFLDIANENIALLPRFPYPDARIICKVARNQIIKDNYSDLIEPLYIRKPDAKLPA